MSDVDRLLSEFIAAQRERVDEDPLPYLQGVQGTDRAELATLIDGYLARAPRRPFDEQAFADSGLADQVEQLSRSLSGASGLWPTLLPSLRNKARIRRAELVRQLAAALGVADHEPQVADYYHQMEQGSLPSAGVSDRVLGALSAILGRSVEALREAGESLGDSESAGAPPAPAFARTTRAPSDAEPPATVQPGTSEWDEVDELFRGRS